MKGIEEILKIEKSTDAILFFVVDILNYTGATVLTYNDFTKKIISSSFFVNAENNSEFLQGIVSRKKQIVPNLKL